MNRLTVIRRTGNYLKSRYFIGLMAMFVFCSSSFAQKDAVEISSAKFKPDKSGDCSDCLCLCIQGSLDFAKLHETYPGAPPGYGPSVYKNKIGFNVGVFATKPIITVGPGDVAAKIGLEFIEKGAKYSESPVTETIGLNYIELPIDALYEYQIQDVGKVFLGFGPYFAYGIGGKDKYNDGTSSTSSNSFGGDGAKRFDFGLQFIGGFRLSCLASISLSYDLGLINIATNNNAGGYNYHDKNGVFSINLSYCLGKLMNQ
jgi:hypothetical protein